MTLTEAIELHRGKQYQQIFSILNAETVQKIGAIRGDYLRDVVSILASGLQFRLDTMQLPAEVEPLRTALLTGFKYMTLPEYAFNLAQPEVMGMLLAGVQSGLVTEEEKDKFVALATFNVAKYPELTFKDIVQHFEPELISLNDWQETEPTNSKKLKLRVNVKPYETTSVILEMREFDNEWSEWSEWFYATAIHGVYLAKSYIVNVPDNGLEKQFRWKGAVYKIDGTLTAV